MTSDLRRFAVGGALRPDSFTGMDPRFSSALMQMFQDAPPEIQQQLQIGSGFRSPERQAQLYADALKKYGSPEAARKWVAPPGKSQHNHGNAADLKYLNPAAQAWAHQNAGNYGLAFPLANENWHIELAGARGHDHAPQTGSAEVAAPAAGLGFRSFGDVVAPPQPALAPEAPNFGTIVASYMQNREKRAEAEAADKARRAALFGDLGSLYG